jgi:hypothetical protein
VIDDGTPKYERNHMLAPSSSTSGDRGAGMQVILPAAVAGAVSQASGH